MLMSNACVDRSGRIEEDLVSRAGLHFTLGSNTPPVERFSINSKHCG